MTEPQDVSLEPDNQAESSESTDSTLSTGAFDFGSPVADAVYRLLADPVATVGGELIDVEWTGGTLRLSVDADDGITTAQLAEVNRLVSPMLDQHDPVPGRYLLEVSSPGIERPLRRPDHFRRAVGEQVIVKLETWSHIRRVRGELLSADDDGISVAAIEIDGVNQADTVLHDLDYEVVAKARTHFDWGPTPKKGGKAGNPPSKNKSTNKKKSSKNKSSNNKRKKR